MNKDVREYLAMIGRAGGTAGTGDAKARTPEQYVIVAEAWWLGRFSHTLSDRHGIAAGNMHDAIPGRKNTGRRVLVCGCTKADFIRHVERQFCPCPYGGDFMAWGNKGRWHIDHIIPKSAFSEEDPFQMLECWHWTNLRPLWEGENWKKSDNILNAWRYPYSERKKWTVAATRIGEDGMTEPIPVT